MFESMDPRFGVAGTTLTLLVVLFTGWLTARSTTAGARLARERLAAVPGGRIRLYRTACVTMAALTVTSLAVTWVGGGVDLADLGVRAPTAGDAVVAGLLSAFLVGTAVLGTVRLANARRAGTPTTGADETVARTAFLHPRTAAERWWAAALAVCVGAGEEVVFRGLLIAAGVGLLGLHPWAAAALSLAAFGLNHLYQGWRGVFGSTVIGLLLTMAYVGTGSILAPTAVHIVYDLAALILLPWLTGRLAARPTPAAPAPSTPQAATQTATQTAAQAAAPAAAPAGEAATPLTPLTLRRAAPE